MEDIIKSVREEHARIAGIESACEKHPEIKAKAITDGLSVVEAKALVFDTEKTRVGSTIEASYINVGAGEAKGPEVLEAAAVLKTGCLRNIEAHYTEKVLEAADKIRRTPLRDMLCAISASEGKIVHAGDTEANIARAAFSTMSLPKLLENIATKTLQESYSEVPSTIDILFETLSAKNFQQHTGVRLGGVGIMEDVEKGGMIKAAKMDEESFNYKLKTVGSIVGLTRQDIIDDDMGGFTRVLRALGSSAAKTKNLAGWDLALENTGNFFHGTKDNLITPALSIDGVSEAVAALSMQVGIDGTPINVSGKFLVVPPQLMGVAQAIYAGNSVQGSSDTTSSANIYQNVYQPVMVPYLSNDAVNVKASATAWYLWSNEVRPFGIAYLNGVSTPVIEEAPLQGELLGRAWRAYLDFGVCQIDGRGAIMSTGAGS